MHTVHDMLWHDMKIFWLNFTSGGFWAICKLNFLFLSFHFSGLDLKRSLQKKEKSDNQQKIFWLESDIESFSLCQSDERISGHPSAHWGHHAVFNMALYMLSYELTGGWEIAGHLTPTLSDVPQHTKRGYCATTTNIHSWGRNDGCAAELQSAQTATEWSQMIQHSTWFILMLTIKRIPLKASTLLYVSRKLTFVYKANKIKV